MTRRVFLLLSPRRETPGGAVTRTLIAHKDRLSEFISAWNRNRPGCVDYGVLSAAEPLGKTFREFEEKLRGFIRGIG